MKIIATYKSPKDEGPACIKTLVWPDSAMIRSGKPVFLPEEETLMLPAMCVRIDAVGKTVAPKFAGRYYNEIAPMAFLLSRASASAIAEGKLPEADDIVADYSVICGDFTDKEGLGLEGFRSIIADSIAAASRRNTLKTGDIVAYITENSPVHVEPDTKLTMKIGGKTLMENKLK